MKRTRFSPEKKQPRRKDVVEHERLVQSLPNTASQARPNYTPPPKAAIPTAPKTIQPAKKSASPTRDRFAPPAPPWSNGPAEGTHSIPELVPSQQGQFASVPVTLEGWRNHLDGQDLSARTKESYYRIGKRVFLSHKSPNDWIRTKFSGDRVSPGTFTNYIAACRQFRTYLERCGAPPSRVGPEVSLPGRTVIQKASDRYEGQALSPEQLKYFSVVVANSEGLSPAIKTILLLMPWTGLRPSEMLKLETKDIVRKGQRFGIKVEKGKRDKDRWVPLVSEARKILLSYMQRKVHGRRYLFPRSASVDRPIAHQTLSKALREHIRPKLPSWGEELKPHELRHTYATNLLRAKVDLAQVQALMGHANIETTKRYLHPDESMLEKSVQAMEEMLTGED